MSVQRSRRPKNFYSPENAAQFLGITESELRELTQQGTITLRTFHERKYYLGGELDCVKGMLQTQIPAFNKEDVCHNPSGQTKKK